MLISASFHWGSREDGDSVRHPKRQAFGTNLIVLKKADGSIPNSLGELYE
ncbi:hypothetical protein ACWDWS_02175 [Streptomyces sp. NPDC003328]